MRISRKRCSLDDGSGEGAYDADRDDQLHEEQGRTMALGLALVHRRTLLLCLPLTNNWWLTGMTQLLIGSDVRK
jgi:hypothetical protein